MGVDLGGLPICEMGMGQALLKQDIPGLQRNQRLQCPRVQGLQGSSLLLQPRNYSAPFRTASAKGLGDACH